MAPSPKVIRYGGGFGINMDISHPEPEFSSNLANASYRETFLRLLLSDGKAKYKRYNGLPLRYAGGKSLAVGHVIEHLPKNLTELVSPFFGGGAVEIACARELGIKVQGYDLFDILVVFWQSVLLHPVSLAETISQWQNTPQKYKAVKKRLKAHWEKKSIIEDDISLAAHYWFNHNLSYGPGFLGWMSSIYECPERYKRLMEKVRRFECPDLSVKIGDFRKTIPAHNGTFLYCDPPYYLDDGKMFKGIYPQRNFPIHHNGFDHRSLNQILKSHKGGFVLSYNDCDTIRKMYADFEIVEVSWQYTMGQGETRIGENRAKDNATHIKKSHEILVVHHG